MAECDVTQSKWIENLLLSVTMIHTYAWRLWFQTCTRIFQWQSIYLGSLFLFVSFPFSSLISALSKKCFILFFQRNEKVYGFFWCITIGKLKWKEMKKKISTSYLATGVRRKWMASQIKQNEKWQKHCEKKNEWKSHKESCFVNVKFMLVLSFGVATVIVSNTPRKVVYTMLPEYGNMCSLCYVMLLFFSRPFNSFGSFSTRFEIAMISLPSPLTESTHSFCFVSFREVVILVQHIFCALSFIHSKVHSITFNC